MTGESTGEERGEGRAKRRADNATLSSARVLIWYFRSYTLLSFSPRYTKPSGRRFAPPRTLISGLYIIEEVAPKVCNVLRIQTVNLNSNLPRAITTMFAKSQMKWANVMQEKYRRNGKVVDKEVRDALVERMIEGVDLEVDQEKIFEEVHNILGGEEGWEDLESPDTRIKMKVKLTQQVKGERSITLGKAEAVADCTAEEACSWFFEVSRRKR